MLSGSQSSYLHQQSQNQVELLPSIGPRGSQGPSSQQTSEPVISAPIHLPRVHGFPHDHYGSTSRAHLHQQQQYQQQLQPQHFQGQLPQQSQMQFPPEHFPRPQGEPISVMMHAHQLVDMLTEENRILRQEMDVCREKVTKLHKVNPFTQMVEVELLLSVGSGDFCICTVVHTPPRGQRVCITKHLCPPPKKWEVAAGGPCLLSNTKSPITTTDRLSF